MAQIRHEISINNTWLTPNLGEIAVGCNCVNVTKLIQMVRFKSDQTITENNYLVK